MALKKSESSKILMVALSPIYHTYMIEHKYRALQRISLPLNYYLNSSKQNIY